MTQERYDGGCSICGAPAALGRTFCRKHWPLGNDSVANKWRRLYSEFTQDELNCSFGDAYDKYEGKEPPAYVIAWRKKHPNGMPKGFMGYLSDLGYRLSRPYVKMWDNLKENGNKIKNKFTRN